MPPVGRTNNGFPALEWLLALYLCSYIPFILITRLLTSQPLPELERPLTAFEILPSLLILNALFTFLFIWRSGWYREAKQLTVWRRRLPCPTRYTLLSGIGTALVLVTVPLSYTFADVSVPYIQLIMRGDLLILAPLVDVIFGRQVRWWSWLSLLLVFVALTITITAREGLGLPPLAISTIALYTLGHLIRLGVMTKVSKSGDPCSAKKYFVEEKLVALPLTILILAILGSGGLSVHEGELQRGFLGIWHQETLIYIVLIAVAMTLVSVFSALILLSPRENSYCVPLERASSILAGIIATYLLSAFWQHKPPTFAELCGATILVGTILLLSLAPRLEVARRKRLPATDAKTWNAK